MLPVERPGHTKRGISLVGHVCCCSRSKLDLGVSTRLERRCAAMEEQTPCLSSKAALLQGVTCLQTGGGVGVLRPPRVHHHNPHFVCAACHDGAACLLWDKRERMQCGWRGCTACSKCYRLAWVCCQTVGSLLDRTCTHACWCSCCVCRRMRTVC